MAIQKETVSRRLEKLRADVGHPDRPGEPLPQDKAATTVGVSMRQWQRWESGESIPYARNLSIIAEKFGFDVSEFDEKPATPDLSLKSESEEPSQLDRIEQRLADIEELLRLLDATSRTTRALLQNEEQLAAVDIPDADDDPAAPAQARREGTTGSERTPGK